MTGHHTKSSIHSDEELAALEGTDAELDAIRARSEAIVAARLAAEGANLLGLEVPPELRRYAEAVAPMLSLADAGFDHLPEPYRSLAHFGATVIGALSKP